VSANTDASTKPLPDVVAVGWGLIVTPLCAVKTLSLEDAAAAWTRIDPPGTMANQWVPAEMSEEQLATFWAKAPEGVERTYPLQCPDHADRHHFLVNC
jgi:hypothetical protein